MSRCWPSWQHSFKATVHVLYEPLGEGVGTELQVADNGTLSITSKRAAYLGSRKTMEFPYSKLMNVEVFTDGIRFHASNRQNTPLFTLGDGMGEVVAATINAAMQRLDG